MFDCLLRFRFALLATSYSEREQQSLKESTNSGIDKQSGQVTSRRCQRRSNPSYNESRKPTDPLVRATTSATNSLLPPQLCYRCRPARTIHHATHLSHIAR